VLPFLLQVGVFFAPVGYAVASLSPFMLRFVELNPLTGVIESWRWMLLKGYHPPGGAIVIGLALSAVVAIAGWLVFTRLETTMADQI
jgi:lipopolysaccharide transport system permease protein